MTAAKLLTKLRSAGIMISHDKGRLIVDAAAGAVTPETHAQLLARKPELIAALQAERLGPSSCDDAMAESATEIAGLLAIAYRRSCAIQHVANNRPNSGDSKLANPSGSSVHGGVP